MDRRVFFFFFPRGDVRSNRVSDLHTDILCWLSLLGSIFTPRDFSSVIFFTAGRIHTKSWPPQGAENKKNSTPYISIFVKEKTACKKHHDGLIGYINSFCGNKLFADNSLM